MYLTKFRYGDNSNILYIGCHFRVNSSFLVSSMDTDVLVLSYMSRGRGGMTARLWLNMPWLENCVRQECDISHSE